MIELDVIERGRYWFKFIDDVDIQHFDELDEQLLAIERGWAWQIEQDAPKIES